MSCRRWVRGRVASRLRALALAALAAGAVVAAIDAGAAAAATVPCRAADGATVGLIGYEARALGTDGALLVTVSFAAVGAAARAASVDPTASTAIRVRSIGAEPAAAVTWTSLGVYGPTVIRADSSGRFPPTIGFLVAAADPEARERALIAADCTVAGSLPALERSAPWLVRGRASFSLALPTRSTPRPCTPHEIQDGNPLASPCAAQHP